MSSSIVPALSKTSDYASDLEGISETFRKPDSKQNFENRASVSTVSASTQTNISDRGDRQPVLSKKWQFSGQFSHSGGVLQGETSDVVLKVPRGAIEKGEFLKIQGAVFIDLAKAHERFELPEGVAIVSPIIEYDADRSITFLTPLEIVLPHFLPQEVQKGFVKVGRFHSDGSAINLHLKPQVPEDKDNLTNHNAVENDDVFFFGKNHRLHILVKHFTGYFCTYDCRQRFLPPELHLQIHAFHVEVKPGKRHVEVVLKAWDYRLAIRDFKEASRFPDYSCFLSIFRGFTIYIVMRVGPAIGRPSYKVNALPLDISRNLPNQIILNLQP